MRFRVVPEIAMVYELELCRYGSITKVSLKWILTTRVTLFRYMAFIVKYDMLTVL